MRFPELSTVRIIEVWQRSAENVWIVSRRTPPDYKAERISAHPKHESALADAYRCAWFDLHDYGAVCVLDADDR